MTDTSEALIRKLKSEMRSIAAQNLALTPNSIPPHNGASITATVQNGHIIVVAFTPLEAGATTQNRIWIQSVSFSETPKFADIVDTQVYPISEREWGILAPWEGMTSAMTVTITAYVSSLVKGLLSWRDGGSYV